MSTSKTNPANESPSPRPRARKRIYIPLLLFILLIAAGVFFCLRGTQADVVEKNPSTREDGTVTQLFEKTNGNVVIRCGIVVDAPPKDVWAVVTDYNSQGDFVPYVSQVAGTKLKDGRYKIDGIAHSRLWGDWPYESTVTNTEKPNEGEYHSTWNEVDHDVFKVSRGSWNVKPTDQAKTQTLLVLTLQIELKDYPNFIVRNIIMDRLHTIVKAMSDETLRRKKS